MLDRAGIISLCLLELTRNVSKNAEDTVQLASVTTTRRISDTSFRNAVKISESAAWIRGVKLF